MKILGLNSGEINSSAALLNRGEIISAIQEERLNRLKLTRKFPQNSIKYCLNKDPFFYAIYSKRFKSFCGLASYLRIKPEIGTIEVGWITYAPNLQKTAEATEAMYLMMKNAFDNLGYRRYEWKCDNLNQKSKKAALRLGFKFEGIFRQATIYKKRNRDTAWFSIIDKEWEKHRKKYLSFLKQSNFDNKLKQKKKLII